MNDTKNDPKKLLALNKYILYLTRFVIKINQPKSLHVSKT